MGTVVVLFLFCITLCSAGVRQFPNFEPELYNDLPLIPNFHQWTWAPIIYFPVVTDDVQIYRTTYRLTQPFENKFKGYKPIGFIYDTGAATTRYAHAFEDLEKFSSKVTYKEWDKTDKNSGFINFYRKFDQIHSHLGYRRYVNWIFITSTAPDIRDRSYWYDYWAFRREYFWRDELRTYLTAYIHLHGMIVVTTEKHYNTWFEVINLLQIQASAVIPMAVASGKPNFMQYMHDLSAELFPQMLADEHWINTKSFVISVRAASPDVVQPHLYLNTGKTETFKLHVVNSDTKNFIAGISTYSNHFHWNTRMEGLYRNLTDQPTGYPMSVHVVYYGRGDNFIYEWDNWSLCPISIKDDIDSSPESSALSVYFPINVMEPTRYHIYLVADNWYIKDLSSVVKMRRFSWYMYILAANACVTMLMPFEPNVPNPNSRLAYVNAESHIRYAQLILNQYYYCRKAEADEDTVFKQVLAKPLFTAKKIGVIILLPLEPLDPLFYAEQMHMMQYSDFPYLQDGSEDAQIEYALVEYDAVFVKKKGFECIPGHATKNSMKDFDTFFFQYYYGSGFDESITQMMIDGIVNCASSPLFQDVDYKLVIAFMDAAIPQPYKFQSVLNKTVEGPKYVHSILVVPNNSVLPTFSLQLANNLHMSILNKYHDLGKALTIEFRKHIAKVQ